MNLNLIKNSSNFIGNKEEILKIKKFNKFTEFK